MQMQEIPKPIFIIKLLDKNYYIPFNNPISPKSELQISI